MFLCRQVNSSSVPKTSPRLVGTKKFNFRNQTNHFIHRLELSGLQQAGSSLKEGAQEPVLLRSSHVIYRLIYTLHCKGKSGSVGAKESGERKIKRVIKIHKYFRTRYYTIKRKCYNLQLEKYNAEYIPECWMKIMMTSTAESVNYRRMHLGLCHPKIATVGTKCSWTL